MNEASPKGDFVGGKRRKNAPRYGTLLCFAAATLTSGACAMSNREGRSGEAEGHGDAEVTVVGRLTGEGVECQALRGDDGQLYTLLGGIGTLPVDTRVRVTGDRLEFSTCQQGITIRVRSISPADTDKK